MYSQILHLQANFHKALAHPRRLEIIQLLRDQELPVTDIYSMLDLPQANVSQHLMILRDNKLVKVRKVGKKCYYCVTDKKLINACDLLRELLIKQDRSLENSLKINMKELVPLVHDPVCQMRLSPKTASFHCQHHSQDYYFCASGCLKKFQQEPSLYVK